MAATTSASGALSGLSDTIEKFSAALVDAVPALKSLVDAVSHMVDAVSRMGSMAPATSKPPAATTTKPPAEPSAPSIPGGEYYQITPYGLRELTKSAAQFGGFDMSQVVFGVPGKLLVPALGTFAAGTPYVPRTGMYELHQGESVAPAGRGGEAQLTVNVNVSGHVIGVADLAAELAHELYRASRFNGMQLTGAQ